jgi:hypothetical protein
MSISGLTGNRGQSVLNAQLQSVSVKPETQLSSTQISSPSQIDSILRAHLLHITGKASEPQTSIEDLIDASSSVNLTRKNLEMLLDLASRIQDTGIQKKLIGKVKETYEENPNLIPTATNDATVKPLIDYLLNGISGDDRKLSSAIEFADSIKNDRLDEFAKQIQGDSALTKVLILAKKQGLAENLRGLEKKFLDRLTDGNIEEFTRYPVLREFLADKAFNSRRAFTNPNQVIVNHTVRFDAVNACAVEMDAITEGKDPKARNFSFGKILKSLIAAKDENAVLDAVADCHKMLTVLEHRYVNGNAQQKQIAAEQLETFYSLIQNRSVMGDLEGVFKDVIVKHQDVLAEIPNVFAAAENNNEDHLYAAAKERLTQIGYTNIPTNSRQFISKVNDDHSKLQVESDEIAKELFSKIFSQTLTSEDEVNRGEVAKQVLTCVNEDTHSVALQEKFDFLKEVFINDFLDKVDFDGHNHIELTNKTKTLLQIYVPRVLHFIPSPISTKEDLKNYLSTAQVNTNGQSVFGELIKRAKEDTLSYNNFPTVGNTKDIKEAAQVLFQLDTLIQNNSDIVPYISNLIKDGVFNPRAITNLRSISNELSAQGVITQTQQVSIEEAFSSYPSDLNRTASAFTSLAQAYLSQANTSADDLYIRINEALGIQDKATDSTFIRGANHGLDKVAEAMHYIYAEIEQGNINSNAERYLYKVLYEDEIAANTTSAIDKHVAQADRGELGLLISERRLGTEETTKKTPEILGLAKIIHKAHEDVQNGVISQPDYLAILQHLEDKIGIKVNFQHAIASNLNQLSQGSFTTVYQDFNTKARDLARFSLEAAKLNQAVNNGATAVPARRLRKMIGREYFHSDKVRTEVEKAQSFLDTVETENPSVSMNAWIDENLGSDSGIIKIALKMADRERDDDYGNKRGLENRSFDSNYSSRLIDIIRNFVRYYMLEAKKTEPVTKTEKKEVDKV